MAIQLLEVPFSQTRHCSVDCFYFSPLLPLIQQLMISELQEQQII